MRQAEAAKPAPMVLNYLGVLQGPSEALTDRSIDTAHDDSVRRTYATG